MSEVKRYHVTEAGLVEGQALGRINVVLGADFDNATRLFLDAAERCVASERREKELQQRLTAADERVDVLEAQLAESRKITLSGCEFSEHELISRAVRAASGTSRRGTQRWVAMRDAFGCGSGVANALCRRFGFDPDEMVKP